VVKVFLFFVRRAGFGSDGLKLDTRYSSDLDGIGPIIYPVIPNGMMNHVLGVRVSQDHHPFVSLFFLPGIRYEFPEAEHG